MSQYFNVDENSSTTKIPKDAKTTLTFCAICNSKDHRQKLKNIQEEKELLRALGLHLNVQEFFDIDNDILESESLKYPYNEIDTKTPTGQDDPSLNLCSDCNERAMELVSLNQDLERLLADIKVIVESFRKAVTVAVGVVHHNDDESCLKGPEFQYISRFRRLVLKQNNNGDNVSRKISKPPPRGPPEIKTDEEDYYESPRDFAILERVTSNCPSSNDNEEDIKSIEAEFICEDNDDVHCFSVEGGIKSEEVSRPTSPEYSLQSSPIAFSQDDGKGEINDSCAVGNGYDSSMDSLETLHYVDDHAQTTRKKSTKRSGFRKGGKSNISKRRKKPQLNLKVQKLPRTKFTIKDLPKHEIEGYKMMKKIKIPFKLLQVQLTRLSSNYNKIKNIIRTEDGNLDSKTQTTVRSSIAANKASRHIKDFKRNRKQLKKLTILQKDRDRTNKQEYQQTSSISHYNDPDYSPPTMDSASDFDYELSDDDLKNLTQSGSSLITEAQKTKRRRKRPKVPRNYSEDVSKVTLTTEPNGSKSYCGVTVVEKPDGTFVCSGCQKEYTTVLALARHIRWKHTDKPEKLHRKPRLVRYRHNSKNGTNSLTDILFLGETELLVNELGIHTCGSCGQLFQTRRSLIAHVKKTHIDNVDSPATEKEAKLTTDVSSSSRKSFNFNFLAKTVYGKDGQMFYGGFEIRLTDNGRHQCITCEKTFKKLTGIRCHIRTTHGEQPMPKRKKKPRNEGTTRIFQMSETPEGKKLYGLVMYEELQNSKDGKLQFRCGSEECERQINFNSKNTLFGHIRRMHLNEYNNKNPNYIPRPLTKIARSVKTADGRVFFRGTEMLRTEDGKHQCGTCQKTTEGMPGLQGHITRHHDNAEGPHICKFCGKTLGYKFLLRNHELTHKKDRDFTCEQCGKTFKHFNSLTHHIRQFHNQEKRHICKICGKGYYVTREFLRHQKTHSNKQDAEHPVFNCDVPGCEESFSSESMMKSHIKHKHSYVNSYKCFKCKSKFRTSVALNDHFKETHGGENDIMTKEVQTQQAVNENRQESSFNSSWVTLQNEDIALEPSGPPVLSRQGIKKDDIVQDDMDFEEDRPPSLQMVF